MRRGEPLDLCRRRRGFSFLTCYLALTTLHVVAVARSPGRDAAHLRHPSCCRRCHRRHAALEATTVRASGPRAARRRCAAVPAAETKRGRARPQQRHHSLPCRHYLCRQRRVNRSHASNGSTGAELPFPVRAAWDSGPCRSQRSQAGPPGTRPGNRPSRIIMRLARGPALAVADRRSFIGPYRFDILGDQIRSRSCCASTF
jgi:hypothetical protein